MSALRAWCAYRTAVSSNSERIFRSATRYTSELLYEIAKLIKEKQGENKSDYFG